MYEKKKMSLNMFIHGIGISVEHFRHRWEIIWEHWNIPYVIPNGISDRTVRDSEPVCEREVERLSWS